MYLAVNNDRITKISKLAAATATITIITTTTTVNTVTTVTVTATIATNLHLLNNGLKDLFFFFLLQNFIGG